MAPSKATSIKIEAPKSPGRPKRAAAMKKVKAPLTPAPSKKIAVKKLVAEKKPIAEKKLVAAKKSPPAKKSAAVKKSSVKKAKEEDDEPKRTNAYILWSKENHERAIGEYGGKNYRKKLGEEWKKLSDEDKAPYKEEAITMMEQYNRLMEAVN